MSVGEAFVFLGSTVHGGGTNTTSQSRTVHGFFFCRSWMRPEVSQANPSLSFDPRPNARIDGGSRKINSCGGQKKKLKLGRRQLRDRLGTSWAIHSWAIAMSPTR